MLWTILIHSGNCVFKYEEGDLEAGARIGKLIFWIGSHGTDGEGVEQPARRRLFATEIVRGADGNFALQTHGQPYKHLLDDFFVDERLKSSIWRRRRARRLSQRTASILKHSAQHLRTTC
jgi:hypothetical protein